MLAIILMWVIVAKHHGKLEMFSLALIAAGAVGNAFDRIEFGYVIDFIKATFIDFPVFNVADICICVGAFLLVIATLFCHPKNSPR